MGKGGEGREREREREGSYSRMNRREDVEDVFVVCICRHRTMSLKYGGT